MDVEGDDFLLPLKKSMLGERLGEEFEGLTNNCFRPSVLLERGGLGMEDVRVLMEDAGDMVGVAKGEGEGGLLVSARYAGL